MANGEAELQAARVRTLEAELEAERRRRAAVGAEAIAARACGDELRSLLGRQGLGHVAPASHAYRVVAISMLAVIVGLIGAIATIAILPFEPAEIDELPSTPLGRLQAEQAALQQQERELRRMLAQLGERLARAKAPPATRPAADQPPPEDPVLAALVRKAQEAYARGNHRASITLSRRVLERQPDHAIALQMVGASACYLKDAATASTMAVRLPPGPRALLVKVCQSNGIVLSGDSVVQP